MVITSKVVPVYACVRVYNESETPSAELQSLAKIFQQILNKWN